MTGSQRSSAGLDARRRRILFRSWHRGIREMDLIMGQFADAHIGELTEAELDVYEQLIEVPDRDQHRHEKSLGDLEFLEHAVMIKPIHKMSVDSEFFCGRHQG